MAAAAAVGSTQVVASGALLLSREERIKMFGLDCGDGLTWKKWEPGSDNAKPLIIKNVSTAVVKLRYQLPPTKYFFLEFPELITLSPGVYKTINVNFRPIALREYTDHITFTVESGDGAGGAFAVPVRALLPTLGVTIATAGAGSGGSTGEAGQRTAIDFGVCAVAEQFTQSVVLTNSGELSARCEWTISAPFTAIPSVVTIESGKSVRCDIVFAPTHASSLEAKAVVNIISVSSSHPGASAASSSLFSQLPAHNQTLALDMTAVSKYPHLTVQVPTSAQSTATANATAATGSSGGAGGAGGAGVAEGGTGYRVDFGPVLVGRKTEKVVTLHNHSAVHATIKLRALQSDHAPVFFLTPAHTAVVPANGSLAITVLYTPVSTGTYTSDQFEFVTPSGHSITITCAGLAAGTSPLRSTLPLACSYLTTTCAV